MLTQQSGGTVEGLRGQGSALRPVACAPLAGLPWPKATLLSYYLDLSLHHHGHGFKEASRALFLPRQQFWGFVKIPVREMEP